jgi:hypothetical protein
MSRIVRVGISTIPKVANDCFRTRTDTNLGQCRILQIPGNTPLFKTRAKTGENRVFFEKT